MSYYPGIRRHAPGQAAVLLAGPSQPSSPGLGYHPPNWPGCPAPRPPLPTRRSPVLNDTCQGPSFHDPLPVVAVEPAAEFVKVEREGLITLGAAAGPVSEVEGDPNHQVLVVGPRRGGLQERVPVHLAPIDVDEQPGSRLQQAGLADAISMPSSPPRASGQWSCACSARRSCSRRYARNSASGKERWMRGGTR